MLDLEKIHTFQDSKSTYAYIDYCIKEIESQYEKRRRTAFEYTAPQRGIIHQGTLIGNVDIGTEFTSNKYAYCFVDILRKQNITTLDGALSYVHYAINTYFGRNSNGREAYASNIGGVVPMEDLEGKNIAVCCERAAVAQNLFSLLGVDSYYVVGSVEYGLPNGGREGDSHAYNIIEYNGRHMIFDSSCCVSVYKDGKEIGTRPYYAFISDEEMSTLLNRGSLETKDGRTYTCMGKLELGRNR